MDVVSPSEAENRIMELLAQRCFAHVVTFGSEMAMLAARDASYRDVLNAADLVVPDTVGVVYAAKLLGRSVRGRVAGIELVEALTARCAQSGVAIYLLGAAPGVAPDAALVLSARYPGLRVAGTQHGYFTKAEEPAVLAAIRSSGARLVLVALGFPRQELWIRRHAAALGDAVCIGVGGSFDVLAGRLQRAPQLVRRAGLEWLYRLVREPRRLRRQLVLPQFAMYVARQALHERLRSRRTR